MRDKGAGAIFKDDRGWRATLELPPGPDGKRRRKYFRGRQKKEVAAKLAEARKTLREDGFVVSGAPSVETWADTWLTTVVEPKLAPSTCASYRQHLRDHILPVLGAKKLDKVTPQDVRQLLQGCRDKGLSSTTVRLVGVTMSGLMKGALRSDLVSRNVCDAVERPARATKEVKLPDAASAARLLRAMSDDALAARWWVSLLTGARKGEVLGLEIDRVDFTRQCLDISWQLQRVASVHGCTVPCGFERAGNCPDSKPRSIPDGKPMRRVRRNLWLQGPKTASSTRVVPMAELLVAPLRSVVEHAARSDADHALIWRPAHDEDILTPDRDSKLWEKLRVRAGCESVRLHDVRHLAATSLLEQGVDVKVIQAILGHSSTVMTRHYQHVDLAESRRAIETLAKRFT